MEKYKPSVALGLLFELMLQVVVNSFKFVALLFTTVYRVWCPKSPEDKIDVAENRANCTKN